MSTRFTVASSKRAREALINLLFPHEQVKKRFTHLELRAAYLKQVHLIHPDKSTTAQRSSACHQEAHEKFVLLQNAWEQYNESTRMFHKSTNSNKQDDNFWYDGNNNFTMFGVGCSFADSPIEREKRNEIMEQASKGWFPSASLSHSSGEQSNVDHHESTQSYTKLSDDDMFMQQQTIDEDTSTVEVKKTLVQDADYKRRRRRNR